MNIFSNVNYSCDANALLQFSVSHDPSEIRICWFTAQ